MDNKDVVRALYGAFEKSDINALDTICTEDLVDHHLPEGLPAGREGLKTFVAGVVAAFSDVRVEIKDLLEEGDKVAVRLTLGGTHTAEFMGSPATGKSFAIQVMAIERLENGRIAERWELGDTMAMLQQLGLAG